MACKAVDKAVKSAVCNYEQDLGTAANSDPKLIHAYVRSKQKVRENISSIETARGYVTSGQDEICLTLNDYFHSVFSVDSDDDHNFPDLGAPIEAECDMSEIDFKKQDVLKKLCELDPSKSTGIDNIHPRVLKACACAFTNPVTLVFKKSIETGSVPELWKCSNVTPGQQAEGSQLQTRIAHMHTRQGNGVFDPRAYHELLHSQQPDKQVATWFHETKRLCHQPARGS
jgi:hypothetical protein